MKHNDGRDYEKFVAGLYNNLLENEEILKYKNIQLELNKKLDDINGIKREFDIYWEYEVAGVTVKTIIECKDYNSTISIEKVDALIGKLRDFPGVTGLLATKKGYQSGALEKAEKNGINLLIVREPIIDDWTDSKGNEYIKEINIDMNVISPNRLISFKPVRDKKWEKNNNILLEDEIKIQGKLDEIFLHDYSKKTKVKLSELVENLDEGFKNDNGLYEVFKECDNVYLENREISLKLKEYTLIYSKGSISTIPIHIDQADYIKGIIEFLGKDNKQAIYKDGKVMKW